MLTHPKAMPVDRPARLQVIPGGSIRTFNHLSFAKTARTPAMTKTTQFAAYQAGRMPWRR